MCTLPLLIPLHIKNPLKILDANKDVCNLEMEKEETEIVRDFHPLLTTHESLSSVISDSEILLPSNFNGRFYMHIWVMLLLTLYCHCL